MKRIVNSFLVIAALALSSPPTPEETDFTEGLDQERIEDYQVEKATSEKDTMPPISFYCCDVSGTVRCTVNAPGPVGTNCFCPGVVPAGRLCLPK